MSCARTFKDTFWARKRVENNITVRELSKLIKCSRATTGAYFTGFMIPDDEKIKVLCDFFDVDFIRGKREFINAHKKYDVDYKRVVVVKSSSKTMQECEKTEEPVVTEKPVIKEERVMGDSDKLDAVKRLLYNKVSYDLYCLIENTPVDKIEETLYDNKVDYVLFNLVRDILSNKVSKVETYDKWTIP